MLLEGVGDWGGVGVRVAAGVDVEVGVEDGDRVVGVGIGVSVGEGVGASVGISVGIEVGTSVGISVGVSIVGVGSSITSWDLTSDRKELNR